MDSVMLSQNGAIIHQAQSVEAEPLMYLSFKVELAKAYTLRSFFRMIEKYALLCRLSAFFPDYLKQYHDCPQDGCRCDQVDYLAMHKTVEMIGFPGRPRLEIYNSFIGMLDNEPCDIRAFQLLNLLDLPVRLGRLKHVIFGDKVDIFEFDTVFSLFEFIEAICWELSFHGVPLSCQIRR